MSAEIRLWSNCAGESLSSGARQAGGDLEIRGLAKLGVKTGIGERVLNHARERIEATCDVHEYIDEKREALAKWAKYLAGLCDSPVPP